MTSHCYCKCSVCGKWEIDENSDYFYEVGLTCKKCSKVMRLKAKEKKKR